MQAMLLTHKNELLYLEHARIYTQDGILVYSQEHAGDVLRFNLPYKNVQALLLGPGCSLTTAAAALLKEGKVVTGFSGGGSTPMFLGAIDYPTNEYAQRYLASWLNPTTRYNLARDLHDRRIDLTCKFWTKRPNPVIGDPADFCDREKLRLRSATDLGGIQSLLGKEGCYVKALYQLHASHYFPEGESFTRRQGANQKGRTLAERVNQLLDGGNFLAYGLAAAALWAVGLPAQFPLIHGLTRDGGLIFDLADQIKDGLVLPWAFESAAANKDFHPALRDLKELFREQKALDHLIESTRLLSGQSTN